MLDILKSTAKSTIIYSFGNLSSRLAGFILIPIYTSHLSLSEYGVLGLLEISSQILIALLGLGLYTAFFRWYWDKQYEGQQKSLFFTIITVVIFICIALFVPVYFGRTFLARNLLENEQYTNLIILLFFVSALEAINVIIATLIRIKDKAVLFSILMLSKLVITLTLNIYFIVYRGKSVEGIYYSLIIGGAAYILMSLAFVLKEVQVKFQRKVLMDMLRFSSPLLIVAITGIVLNITDRYTLKFLSDMDEVGKYSLAFKISNTIRVFIITSVNMALQPVIYRMIGAPNNKRFYSKVMTYYSLGLMFFVLALAMFSSEIIKVLSDNTAYWPSNTIIPILSLGMFFTMLRDVALTGINITKKTFITARVITISVILNIVLCISLVSLIGSYGAAVAAATSQFIFFVLAYRFAQKEYFIPYELGKIIKIIALAAILFFVSTMFSDFSLWTRLLLKPFLLLSFPLILYLIGFYEAIELERIHQFWLKWKDLTKIIDNFKSLKSN